jgi:Protein of unknown function (DUF1501)
MITNMLPNRRKVLTIGATGIAGLTLPSILKANATRNNTSHNPKADSCIVIFLNGGASHLDMWDMKPEAPAEIRGEFKPIASSVPGVMVSEHLPGLARVMHHGTLVRSMHHSVNNSHAAAVYTSLTGHDRGEMGGGAKPTDIPAIGSVLARYRPPAGTSVPFVSMPYITKEGAGGPPQPGFFGGIMGKTYDPMFVLRDPNSADFGLPELTYAGDVDGNRMGNRRNLIHSLGKTNTAKSQDLDAFQTKAFDLLASERTRTAFKIEQEPVKLRDAYGRNIYGQSVLLARRLIEAGSRLACISWAPDANATWDTHGNNFKKLKGELLPHFDLAIHALINDLTARGMLDRTLVAVLGDFGRTPKVNANAGRDHWNFCYSLMVFGGGFKKGLVYGASDRIGSHPSLNPLTPADIISTMYHCLGVSHELEIMDRLSRPQALCPWGNPVTELLA